MHNDAYREKVWLRSRLFAEALCAPGECLGRLAAGRAAIRSAQARGPAQGLQPPLVDASVEVLVSARAEHFGLKSLGEHGKGLVLDRSDRI